MTRRLALPMSVRRHPNGHVVLQWVHRDGTQTRLHYWPRSSTRWSETHSHRYDFTSWLLFGDLEEEHYDVVAGESHRLVREEHERGQPYRFIDEGRCGVVMLAGQRHPGRQRTEAEVFHRVRALGRTATFVRAERPSRGFTQIVRTQR